MPNKGVNVLNRPRIPVPIPPWVAGRWYEVGFSTSSTYTTVNPGSDAEATLFYVPNRIAITAIVAEQTTAGAAGSLARFGLYKDDGFSNPGALVVDAGTVATDGANGAKSLAVSVTLDPGLYWTVIACTSTAGIPVWRAQGATTGFHWLLAGYLGNPDTPYHSLRMEGTNVTKDMVNNGLPKRWPNIGLSTNAHGVSTNSYVRFLLAT